MVEKMWEQNIQELDEKYNIVVYMWVYRNNKLISQSEKIIGHTTKEYDDYIDDLISKLKEQNIYYKYIPVNFYTSNIQIWDNILHANIIIRKRFL